MTGMMDQTFVNALLNNLYKTSGSAATIVGGSSGGTTQTITNPFHLRLFSTVGSETATGTEQSSAGGYTAGGSSLGTVFAGTIASGAFSNANAVSWTATATWSPSTQTAIEIWDTSGTPIRHLWGLLTASITGVANGDTVTFAIGSITVSAATW